MSSPCYKSAAVRGRGGGGHLQRRPAQAAVGRVCDRESCNCLRPQGPGWRLKAGEAGRLTSVRMVRLPWLGQVFTYRSKRTLGSVTSRLGSAFTPASSPWRPPNTTRACLKLGSWAEATSEPRSDVPMVRSYPSWKGASANTAPGGEASSVGVLLSTSHSCLAVCVLGGVWRRGPR